MPIHMCTKFYDIWLSHFQIILHTKKWVEIRKINNKGNFNKIIRWSVLDTAHLINNYINKAIAALRTLPEYNAGLKHTLKDSSQYKYS